MSMTPRFVARAVLALALTSAAVLPLAVGCAPHGPSNVGRGQEYRTGNPAFDPFFAELHEISVDIADAPKALTDARSTLAGLAAGDDEDDDADGDENGGFGPIARRLKKRLAELGEHGTSVKLLVPDDDEGEKLQLEIGGAAPDDDAKQMLRSLESTVKKLHRLAKRMRRHEARLTELNDQLPALRGGVDSAFPTMGKRAEVKKNLNDAAQLIPLLQSRARETGKKASGGLERLGDSISIDAAAKLAGPAAPAPAAPPSSAAPAPAPKPAPRPAPGPAPAAAPRPAPKPAPSPGGDFEP